MSVHRLQAQAIERALRVPGSVVQVMGPKEGRRPLVAGERLCTASDAGERVVYHVSVVPTHDGQHACAACGHMSSGSAGKSKRPRLAS